MASAGLTIAPGSEVEVRGHRYVITAYLDLESALAKDSQSGEVTRLFVRDMQPVTTAKEARDNVELATINDVDWQEAQRRFSFIQPLLAESGRRRAEVATAAEAAGVHVTTLYRWIADYESNGKISALLPHKPSGGRGKGRLPDEIEVIVKATIEDFYLQDQQRSVQATADEVFRRCRTGGIAPPHASTVRRRISTITEEVRLRRRANRKRADDKFNARPGAFVAERPLQIVQIDHTKLDIECVDEVNRRPIGRPWLTLAIDVYSRMAVGFYLSLDPPGDASVGLCLVRAILLKDVYLAGLGLTTVWPCWGVPGTVHADNGRDFRGKMLRRAAQEYGFNLEFRPVKTPHFGAHIERLMGTIGTEIHKWLGTTFSNHRQKAEYDSGKTAVFTLAELERSVAEFITGVYHERPHGALDTSPRMRYKQGFAGDHTRPAVGLPMKIVDEESFRLNFMPFIERTVQAYGVVIDDIHYYHDVLRPYIHASGKERNRKFLFRRDPRDISAIYFLDPETKQYAAIPYRNTSYPAMSIWELREIHATLRGDGKAQIDEAAIFESLERLRTYEEQATKETRKLRRTRQRRVEHARVPKLRTPAPAIEAPATDVDDLVILPYDDLR